MHRLSATDGGRRIDWGETSDDYARYRPGPPDSFYSRLAALGVGIPGQQILDLGTGTGVLARRFANQGADVVGIDIAEKQIATASRLAEAAGLDADFRVASAEGLPGDIGTFDIATAHQCWLYFNPDKVLEELGRVLKPGGLVVTGHFCWLPLLDPVASATENLILEHNSDWSAAGYEGKIPPLPRWAEERDLTLQSMFWYDEAVPFTREEWRGRIRACRGVGAALSPEEVNSFDREHAALLERTVPEEFTVLHRVDAHIIQPGGKLAASTF